MKIYKILNNNVIIMKDENDIEEVVMGKGIGFKRNVGETLDFKLVDKVFRLEDSSVQDHFNLLSSEIPYPILKITEEFIDLSKSELKQNLNESLHISLVDHIFHAIKRHENGQNIANSLVWDIQRLYSKEYDLSLKFLEQIKNKLGIELQTDEAGFIAMHLINAEMNEEMKTTLIVTEEVTAILKIVKYQLGINYDETSVNYYRFVTHLKFFVQRVVNKISLDGDDDELYHLMKKKHVEAYECSKKIEEYVYKNFQVTLTSEEKLYLIIHLKRLISK